MEDQPPAEKDTPLSSQVLEYYRNYSQSHQLPRYLCGELPNTAAITNLVQGYYEIEGPNIQSVSTIRRPPLIGQDNSMLSGLPPVVVNDSNADNRGQISPTSSITSNRKLEWDNGADIGYENCEVANRSLFRSYSLPALNTLERNIQKDILRHSPDGRISEKTQKNIAKNYSTSSTDDSGTKFIENVTYFNTTSGNDNPNQRTSTSDPSSSIIVPLKSQNKIFASSSSSLEHHNSNNEEQNIFYMPVFIQSPPLAESTPNIGEKQISKDSVYNETPFVVHPRKPPRKNPILITEKSPQKLKSTSFDNLPNLQLLNETVEQRNAYFQKYLTEKQQNLCITKAAAIEYTNKSAKDNASIAIQTEYIESSKDDLIYSDHYISDKEDGSSTDGSSKIVDCNSFEYHNVSAIVPKVELSPEVYANAQVDFISNTLKHSKAKSDLTNVTSTDTNSIESRSAKISSKLSNNLISDVEKSVDLLIRLLYSKKYDEVAKKYYIRKIIRKIVDSKYDDDRTTSSTRTSSTPTNKTTSSSNTSEVPELKLNYTSKIDPPLMLPANGNSKSDTNLQGTAGIYPRLQRNPRFTLTNNEFCVGQNKGNDNDNTSSDLFRPHSMHVFPSYTTDSSVQKMQNTSSTSQSWKDDKTASERLMESQKPIMEDSDELVGFAQRERQSQLNWISNEINHLSKLKLLLEKKDFNPGSTQSTAIYMITTDKNDRESSRPPCKCHNRLNIPNVISATKTQGHHHIKLQQCSHKEQEYKIKQIPCEHNQCNCRESACSCQHPQQYSRKRQRADPLLSMAMPSSSEDQQEISNQSYKQQYGAKQNMQDDMNIENKNSVSTSIGVTCTLLPSRAALSASEQEHDLPESRSNVQEISRHSGSSHQTEVVFTKNTSVPITSTSSSKRRTTKVSVATESSNRKIETRAASKGELKSDSTFVSKATLLSSDVYQCNDYPTTSVRRYVFEIPICSTDFGINKKEIGVEQDVHSDIEVKNIQYSIDEKQRKRKSSVTIEVHKTNQKDKLNPLNKQTNFDDAIKSASAKVLSHNTVAGLEIGPSINRETVPSDKLTYTELVNLKSSNESEPIKSSLGASTSKVKEISTLMKPNERNEIIQTADVRLKTDEKGQDTKRKVTEKSGNIVNEAVQRSTGSQTSSLENYMKELIAEAIGSNNSNQRKVSYGQAKTTTDSDKESLKKDKDIYKNDDVKSDPSSRRMSNATKSTTDSDKESFIQNVDDALATNPRRVDSSRKNAIASPNMPSTKVYQEFFKRHQIAVDDAKSDSRRLAHSKTRLTSDRELRQNISSVNKGSKKVFHTKSHLDESEKKPDGTLSSFDFIPKGPNNFENVERNVKGRARINPEEISSDNEDDDALTRGSKSKDFAYSVKTDINLGNAPLREEVLEKELEAVSGNNKYDQVTKDKQGNFDVKQREIMTNGLIEKGSFRSSSSESKLISDKSRPAITTSDHTMKICQCCRDNNISLDNMFSEAIHHPLCQACYQVHQHSLWRNHAPFYMYPNHMCNCHTLIKTRQLHAIKTTINQLQNLERTQQTTCICPPHNKLPQQNNKCLTCDCPIKSYKIPHQDTIKARITTTKHNPKHDQQKQSGITYTLKVDTTTEDDVTEEKTEEKLLGRYEEEVVVKVPIKKIKSFKKGALDKEQKSKKGKQTEGDEKENNGRTRNGETKKDRRRTSKTLQEYLSTNRPTFIESAEQRRRCLIELAYMREERCQKYKQLLALTNGMPVILNGQHPQNKGLTTQKPRIFSTKEMKRLTAKNYKILPEVQQRLFDNKERQMKKANRLLSDIFNKKLRDKVLKGQPSLSTSVSVINLM